MNNKGQSILAEHVAVFFIVIAALVSMSVFVQRAFKARIHDARNYMINAANAACDADCQKAAGKVQDEYEPYYMQMLSDSQSNASDYQGATSGNAQSMGVIDYHVVNEKSQAITTSGQLPSACADSVNPKPSYCAKL